MFPHIHIFERPIPVYGILLIVSGVAMWLLLTALSKKEKHLCHNDILSTYLIAICGGIIGAVTLRPIMRFIEVAVFWERYAAVPAGILLQSIVGEIVFYGGLLGAMAAIFIFCSKYKIKVIPLLDLFAPTMALGHAIGRLGCLLGGCCYGVEVSHTHPFAIIYPPSSLSAPAGLPLLAVPLIEAIFLFLLFVVLLFLRKRSDRPGLCASVYLIAYSIARFVLEFFRGDLIRGRFGPLTTSQYISITLFVFGIAYFARTGYIAKRKT